MNLATRILSAHEDGTLLYFLGQAGFVLKSRRGTLIGIDLYLSNCVERFDGFKRLLPKLLEPTDISFDYIITSHWHYDHFDIDSIPLLMDNQKTQLLAASDCKTLVSQLHLDMSRITFLSVGDSHTCQDIQVQAVFCDHGNSAPLAVGLVIMIDDKKIYMTGDTSLRLDKAESIKGLGPFDVIIAPINGTFGNLNEAEAVSLCGFFNPKLMIPCHYWNFAEQHGDPGKFMELIHNQLPNQQYLIMAPGECHIL